MINIIIKWLFFSVLLLIVAWIVPGIDITSFGAAFVSAAVIALINTFIKPFIMLVTLPINLLTLGLFTLIINALLLMLAAYIVPGFSISGFFAALFGFILFSLLSMIVNLNS